MKIKNWVLGTSLAVAASVSQAAEIEVEITNLTQGIYFTPLLVAAHGHDTHLFKVGMAASAELEAMAEMGDISGLATLAQGAGAVVSSNPGNGLLTPGMSITTGMMDAGDMMYLSITAMLLPTNDGFVGLDSWMIPSTPGSYTIMLNGYDAGTEANNELLNAMGMDAMEANIPANPGMNGGTGGTGVTDMEPNATVHIHRGTLGDDDASGGKSDLNNAIHRWLNPVAKVVVTVSE